LDSSEYLIHLPENAAQPPAHLRPESQKDGERQPQLLSLAVSPAAVDVTLAPQTMTFTVHVTDNLAGISYAYVSLRSPSGAQSPYGFGYAPAGSVLDATFDAPALIQRYSEPGIC
jgi:hypothetical protein